MKSEEVSMRKVLLSMLCLLACLSYTQLNGQYPKWDVPYVPTPYQVVNQMLDIANVTSTDILYDLGCGDGRIVITAASRTGTKGVGIEIDPERIKECRAHAAASNVENLVTFLNEDLFEADFQEATVLTLYLLNSVNLKLRPKILSQLKPGTRIVSHDFSMGDWKPDKETSVEVDYRIHNIYFWTVPVNASGTWRINQPSELSAVPFTLTIKQRFQNIEGQVSIRNSVFPLKEARLHGDRIAFVLEQLDTYTLGPIVFTGTLQEHNLEGTVTFGSGQEKKTAAWQGKRDPKSMQPLDLESVDLMAN